MGLVLDIRRCLVVLIVIFVLLLDCGKLVEERWCCIFYKWRKFFVFFVVNFGLLLLESFFGILNVVKKEC